VNLKVAPVVAVAGGVEYQNPRVGTGTDDRVPSIDDTYDDSTAPGLSGQPDYLRTLAIFDVDYRQPRNARRGGWYHLELSRFEDRDLGLYTFSRADLDVRQFVSFLSERRIFAARAFVSTSDTKTGQTVPFYLMPTLGGNDSLRGFRPYRFRGPHALLLQGEYRFEVWSGLDAALFYDAGKVAMNRSDLDFKHLESDYGFGFRFNTDNGTILRVDAAFGSRDGKHLWIIFGGTF
jgi:outer membrane translocation and assembly module TamA